VVVVPRFEVEDVDVVVSKSLIVAMLDTVDMVDVVEVASPLFVTVP